MTEKDLGQKLAMRRIYWAMGASTRLDVKLSALVPRSASRTRAGMEEWTDLDVLAVEYGPLAGVTVAVADCKTLKGRVAERVFWLRGVADLFDARSAYLVRDEQLPSSSRQLALRLGLSALDPRDREALATQLGEARLPIAGSFFEASSHARWTAMLTEAPKAIERLERYRRSTYWVAGRHRNLTFLPSRLRESAASLDAQHLWAVAYVADLAWLYLYALLAALDDMSALHLAEPSVGLQQVVVGTESEVREKRFLADQLASLLKGLGAGQSEQTAVDILPDYIGELGELMARLARRRHAAVDGLRVLEFASVESIANRGATWEEAFPGSSPYGPKLAADVVRFLVRVGRLESGLLDAFEAAIGPSARDPGAPPKALGGATRTSEAATAAPTPAQARLFDATSLGALTGAAHPSDQPVAAAPAEVEAGHEDRGVDADRD